MDGLVARAMGGARTLLLPGSEGGRGESLSTTLSSVGKGISLAVLVALGVKATGEKVFLPLGTSGAETATAWQIVLEDLAARHLGRPQLVISDGNVGLQSALEQIWRVSRINVVPCSRRGDCNLLAKAPEHTQESAHEQYNRIIYDANRAAAERVRESFLARWGKPCPSVAASLKDAGEELLTSYDFPASQHKPLRTTNAIEHLQEEFRRRVKT